MNTAPEKPSDRPSLSEAKQASARREREASGSAGAELKKLMRPKGATFRFTSSMLALFLAVSTATREALSQETLNAGAAAVEQTEAQRIAKIERKFLELEARVLPLLNLYVEDPGMRTKIRKLFEIVRMNRYMAHPAGFRYEFVKGMYHPASFHGKKRVFSLPENFDADDMGSLDVLAHELAHVEHDNERRVHVPLGRYDAYWAVPSPDGKTIVVVARDEADAIARQLELLNALMHGELKRRVREDLPLGIPAKDDYTRKFLERFAQEYFQNPRDFQAAVERIYRSFPHAVFFTPDLTQIP